MAHSVRCISKDGTLFIMAADTSDIVETARLIHSTSKVCSAALGRLLTAGVFMGQMLKGESDTLTLRIKGGRPAGVVVAVADSKGNVKGYIENPNVELPLNEKGKLDVGKAVGKDGFLTVMRDLGLKEPYIGQVPLVSGEIAEDITAYYAMSEQTPTVCALGVLVNPDKTIAVAGGFIVQLLPTADDKIIEKVEKSLEDIPPVTKMLAEGMTPVDICKRVLSEFELELLDETNPEYRCGCSKDRVVRALISLGKEELLSLAEDEVTEVNCQFCNKKYKFTPGEIKALVKEV